MFILGDDTHDRGKIPWVTFTLIAVNILVFSAQIRFGERMTNGFALVPKEITEFRDITTKQPIKVPGANDFFVDEDGDVHIRGNSRVQYIPHHPGPVPIVLTLFTYMFLHGDFFHLIFNLWFLFIFGRNIECALDHGRFLAFYIFCGVMAGLSQVGADYKSVVPVVGASGAIAGVMGAYMAIFPWNNMKVLLGGIGLMFGIVEMPAFIVVGIWFCGEFLLGMISMNHEIATGSAFWCHIGGFVTGFASIKALAMYLNYQVSLLDPEEAVAEPEELPHAAAPPPPPLDDALSYPDVPTQAQFENMIDPVEAFKRAREGVFRAHPENDPFRRGGETPKTPEPIVDDEIAHGIIVKK
ncbi:MAG: rhomboid family intramembrane serine protease [Planctomycetota bacterium]